jgi:hypothetical protein
MNALFVNGNWLNQMQKVLLTLVASICFETFVFCQGINLMDSRKPRYVSKYQFGVQVVPFLMVPRLITTGPMAVGNVLVSYHDFANANPSLQAGFFLNRQFNDRWLLRLDATLLERRITYWLQDRFSFNAQSESAIATTVHTAVTAHIRIFRRLHVGGGIGTQFNFVSGYPFDPLTNITFRDVAYELAHNTIRPVTLHAQYGLIWKFTKWNVGLMLQQSLNSFNTPLVFQGREYDFVQLYTQIYTLNLGYVLAPPKRPRKREHGV